MAAARRCGSRIEREWDDARPGARRLPHGGAQSIFTPRTSATAIAVPKPLGAKAFEVVGIPLAAPGFYVVELASPRLGAALFGKPRPYYVRTAALVTNLGVHFKLGHEIVAGLGDAPGRRQAGEGRAGQRPRLRRQELLEGRDRRRGHRARRQGAAHASGAAGLRRRTRGASTSSPRACGDDLSFAFSDWGEGIAPWRFNVPTGRWTGPYVAHAVLDRSLVRAGETVSMKVFVRE